MEKVLPKIMKIIRGTKFFLTNKKSGITFLTVKSLVFSSQLFKMGSSLMELNKKIT